MSGGNRRGVDPADIAVGAPVNDVQPAAGTVLEHDAGSPGQIELHDRLADRKPLQRRGGLGDDDRAVGGDLVVLGGRLDYIARRVQRRRSYLGERCGGCVGLAGGAVLQAALVAAQALLDHHKRLVGAGIGVGGVRICFQRNPGIKMQRAVGAEAEAVLAQRDVAGIVAVEIFSQDFIGALADARTKRFANTDALPGDSKGHWMPRWMPTTLTFASEAWE